MSKEGNPSAVNHLGRMKVLEGTSSRNQHGAVGDGRGHSPNRKRPEGRNDGSQSSKNGSKGVQIY